VLRVGHPQDTAPGARIIDNEVHTNAAALIIGKNTHVFWIGTARPGSDTLGACDSATKLDQFDSGNVTSGLLLAINGRRGT
jgi:hypothetical protein